MGGKAVRTLLTVVIDILIVLVSIYIVRRL